MYRKHDRYKEELSNYFKEAKREVEEVMSKILSNPPPKLIQRLTTMMSSRLSGQSSQMKLVIALTTTEQAPIVPSSITSTRDKVHSLVDEIDSRVHCSLVIRYGFNNNSRREVATGLMIPWR